jgi:hypothetical protein
LIVIDSATMSTAPERSSGIRCSSVSARNSILSGLPKIAVETARSTSMSKPSICPS